MTDIEREGRNRLYKDTGKARYVTRSESLIPAIIAKHRLSAIDIVVFGKIADYCDSRSGEPYVASCGDICKYLKDAFTRSGIAKSIKTLIKLKLIIQVKEERKGKSKGAYVPNVKYIHKLINAFE